MIHLQIEDYCLKAKIELNLEAIPTQIVYMPGEAALTLDLAKDIESGFSLSSGFKESCGPIVFTYKTLALEGGNVEQFLTLDLEK